MVQRHPQQFTSAELKLICQQRERGVKITLIAKDLGRSRSAVGKKANDLGYGQQGIRGVSFTWYMTHEMYDLVQEESEEFGVSKSQYMRMVLEAHFLKDGKIKDRGNAHAGALGYDRKDGAKCRP